jgi:hypothetical protein
MNRTTKIVVALIVAAGLSTMVYAIPEQRAMAHLRLSSDPSDDSSDAIPFGPNSPDPASKSDPPAVGPNSADPPPSGTGPPFGPNCVGCISTQNLANGAVTNPKLATGSVLSANIGAGQVIAPNIADHNITTQKIAPGAVSISTMQVQSNLVTVPPNTTSGVTASCPSGSVVTGGGYNSTQPAGQVVDTNANGNGWVVFLYNPTSGNISMLAYATCATIHP